LHEPVYSPKAGAVDAAAVAAAAVVVVKVAVAVPIF
jgi:hypothetical protein